MKTYNTLSQDKINKKIKKFDKTYKNYHKKMIIYYDKDFAEQIKQDTLKFYKEILPITPIFDGKTNIGNTIGIAFYKAMKQAGKTLDDAVLISYEIADEAHNSIPKIMVWIIRGFIFSRMFLKRMNKSFAKMKDNPAGWKIEYKKADNKINDFYFHCTECGVIKYFNGCGVPELSRYCNFIDYIQGKAFGLGVQNPHNIGQGDAVCEEFMKRGRKTEVPENLVGLINKYETLKNKYPILMNNFA